MTASVVVSALIGNRTRLYAALHRNPDWRYVCFTNNKKVKSLGWEIVHVAKEIISDCRDAKRFKMRTREYINYERCVWIDAHCRLAADPETLWPIDGDIKVVSHWRRPSCVYHEARACTRRKKCSPQLIEQQVQQYRQFHPPRKGLWYGGFIAHSSSQQANQFFDKWWMLTQAGSSRDQISMPVAARLCGTKIDAVSSKMRGNIFHVRSH